VSFVVVVSSQCVAVQNLAGDLDGTLAVRKGLDQIVQWLSCELLGIDIRFEEEDQGIEISGCGLRVDEKCLARMALT